MQEAEAKSTLKFLDSASYAPGKIHIVWAKCKHNSNSLLKAYVQVKLSSGSYIFNSVRARFNQFHVSKLCPLCRTVTGRNAVGLDSEKRIFSEKMRKERKKRGKDAKR